MHYLPIDGEATVGSLIECLTNDNWDKAGQIEQIRSIDKQENLVIFTSGFKISYEGLQNQIQEKTRYRLVKMVE